MLTALVRTATTSPPRCQCTHACGTCLRACTYGCCWINQRWQEEIDRMNRHIMGNPAPRSARDRGWHSSVYVRIYFVTITYIDVHALPSES